MKKTSNTLLAAPTFLIFFCLLHTAVQARENPGEAATLYQSNPQFISVMGFYLDADRERGYDEGRGGRVVYGYELSPRWHWETDGFFAVHETGAASGIDYYQTGVATGFSWSLFQRSPTQWTPFVLGTLGAVYNDVLPDSEDGVNPYLALGVGAVSKSLFDNGLKLRAEARYVADFADSDDYQDWHFSAGIEIPLGIYRVKEVIRETVVYQDRMVEVERLISEPDQDGDGIPDSRDECPDTLPGARVDNRGCIIEAQTITFNNITFELGSSTLTWSAQQSLAQVARAFSSQKDFKVQIAGHTDSQGAADFNQRLSEQRAAAVKQFLIENGVEEERLESVGYGVTQPIADNSTVSGRAMNRRVEFNISR